MLITVLSTGVLIVILVGVIVASIVRYIWLDEFLLFIHVTNTIVQLYKKS